LFSLSRYYIFNDYLSNSITYILVSKLFYVSAGLKIYYYSFSFCNFRGSGGAKFFKTLIFFIEEIIPLGFCLF
jgi:hypothetical protein